VLKLHIDTDIGGDLDDLCALALALNWPDVELVAVTTVAEQQGKRAGYTRYALRLAGRADVPVAAGADAASGVYREWPALPPEERYWPEPISPAPTSLEEALDLLARSIEQDALIVAIGPFTNLALLEKRSPGILRRARLYLMGGYVFPPGEGFPRWDSRTDYNVQVDVQSAHYVLQHANPTLITLAVTVETALRRAYLPALRQAGPLAQLIAHQAEAFAKDEQMEARFGQTCAGVAEDIINFQHDPLCCAIALGWRDGVEIDELPLTAEIEDGWLCQKVDDSGRLTKVVTRVDGSKFSEFWLDTVTGASEQYRE
jgi:purine nucleosidase